MTGSRFQRLAMELRERISLGDVGPAGALESEAELGARYGVSRVTVRRALEHLRDEGLVAARRGSGWYVVAGAAFGQSVALGTFRHAPSAVADAGLRLSRRVVGYEYLPPPDETARLLALKPGADALRVRAVRLAGASPLDVVVEWVPLEFAAPVSRADAEDPGLWETLRQRGHAVDVVRQSMAATAASEAVAGLLDIAVGSPVLLVRRLALLAPERPLAVSEHRYVGHRFRLDVEFRGWPTTLTDPPGVTPVT